jgi:hypothetical protein
MEYVATSIAKGENGVKIVLPYELPTEDTSIKVYIKFDR